MVLQNTGPRRSAVMLVHDVLWQTNCIPSASSPTQLRQVSQSRRWPLLYWLTALQHCSTLSTAKTSLEVYIQILGSSTCQDNDLRQRVGGAGLCACSREQEGHSLHHALLSITFSVSLATHRSVPQNPTVGVWRPEQCLYEKSTQYDYDESINL